MELKCKYLKSDEKKKEFYLIKLPDAFFKNEETGSNLKSLKKM